MRKLIKLLLLLFFIILINGFKANADEKLDWHNKDLIIKGEYLKVLMVIEKDFISRINNVREKLSKNEKNNNNKLADYLSKIENYNIEIAVGNGKYTVWVTPRTSREFPVIFGGDAIYTIDSTSFNLLESQYGK